MFGRGATEAIEPLLMMRPPFGSCDFIWRNAACVHRKRPVRFVSMTRFHASSGRSSSGVGGALLPALLNSTSMRP